MSQTSPISFIPQAHESTEELKTLFSDVQKLIADYKEKNPNQDEMVVRRFVAGEVCREDLNQFSLYFPGSTREGKLNASMKFTSEQQRSKKRTFREMPAMSVDYKKIKKDNPKQIEAWEAECKVDNEKPDKLPLPVRQEMFKKTIGKLERISVDLLNNFDTHVLFYTCTDTVLNRFYPPIVYYNSSMLYLLKGSVIIFNLFI